MAKTLTIAGSDYKPKMKTSSVQIKEKLRAVYSMNFEAVTESMSDAPQQGAEIIYKDDTRFLFAGYISRVQPKETGIGQKFNFSVEASDYSYIFNNKIVRRAYTNTTLGAIVADIMDDFVGASYGFDLTNVVTGPTIASISFDHISVKKAFEKLSKTTGYVWRVDYEKKLYFQLDTATLAPETITDSSANVEDISIAYDTTQVRNSIIVIGSTNGVQSLDSIQQHFEGDGDTRSWELEESPSEVIYIKKNAATQQFSLDLNERESDNFVYSFSGKSFRLTTGETTPTLGDDIDISYYPRIPVIEQRDNASSIAFFANLDGGDGVYEYTIKDASISTMEEAAERAQKELDEYSMPLVAGVFRTRTGLLQSGSIFKPGQILTVNLPSHGLSTDTAFMIQEVTISVIEGSATEYMYTVKFGGKIATVQGLLDTLASEQSNADTVSTDEEILTIEALSDSMEFEDEAPVETIETPPYKWSGEVLLTRYARSNYNADILFGTTNNKVAQSFVGNGNKLSRSRFYIKKASACDGTFVSKLYAASGSLPTGSALATSNSYNANDLTTSYQLIEFKFPDGQDYTLVNGTTYFISCEYSGTTPNGVISIGADNSSPTHSGVPAFYTTVWNTSTSDRIFDVYVNVNYGTKWNLSEFT